MTKFNYTQSIKDTVNKIEDFCQISSVSADALSEKLALELVRHTETILQQLEKSPVSNKIKEIHTDAINLATEKNSRNTKDKLLPVWKRLLNTLETAQQSQQNRKNSFTPS